MFVIPQTRHSRHRWQGTCLAVVFAWSGCGESRPTTPGDPAVVPQRAAVDSDPGPLVLEPGFQWIAFAECKTFPEEAAGSWSAPDERTIATTGKPKSYLYTDKDYANFTLRYDYRFPSPPSDPAKAPLANTGVLLFIEPPHAIWPKALEVQGKFVEMGAIRPNGGAAEVPVKEEAGVRESARRPVGDWNTVEVAAKEGTLNVSLNGQRLLGSEAGELTKGLIGFQAEGHAVEFRNVRVRVDP